MRRNRLALLLFILVFVCGYVTYVFLGLEMAVYVATIIGAAAGVTTLFRPLIEKRVPRVRSKVSIGRAEDAMVLGLDTSEKDLTQETEVDVAVNEIRGGEVIGVRRKKRP